MKTLWLIVALAMTTSCLFAQGTFIYDQQSSIESQPAEAAAFLQTQALLGQSFTPSLAAVGFVRLDLYDPIVGNSKGATVYINLRSDSIGGTILATSTPVSMPEGFGAGGGGFANFLFATPVPVTPGIVYYFDLAAQSGSDLWGVRRFVQGSDYPGGTEYLQGQPGTDDFWFREGIVVPEPSSVALLFLGTGILFWRRRVRHH